MTGQLKRTEKQKGDFKKKKQHVASVAAPGWGEENQKVVLVKRDQKS